MRGSSVWPREGLALGHAVLNPTFLYLTILLLAPGHVFPFFQKPSMFDVSRELGSSVALYSRKVLIQTKATDILPKWLRFVRGTVAATQALVWTVAEGSHVLVLLTAFASAVSQTILTQWDSAPLGNSWIVLADQVSRVLSCLDIWFEFQIYA